MNHRFKIVPLMLMTANVITFWIFFFLGGGANFYLFLFYLLFLQAWILRRWEGSSIMLSWYLLSYYYCGSVFYAAYNMLVRVLCRNKKTTSFYAVDKRNVFYAVYTATNCSLSMQLIIVLYFTLLKINQHVLHSPANKPVLYAFVRCFVLHIISNYLTAMNSARLSNLKILLLKGTVRRNIRWV